MFRRENSCGVIPLQKRENGIWTLVVQHRNGGHWAYPKGHVEKEESAQQTAERELREETSLRVVEWLDMPPFTEIYTFSLGDDLVEKQVEYFAAFVAGDVELQEAEMLGFEWLPIDEAKERMSFQGCKRITSEIQALLLAW